MTRPHPNNPTRTRACSVKPYLTLASVLILMHVEATVGMFICGQTVCEGKGFDTCRPHPISGNICQPCRDFKEYCNSTSMPQGCNPYCLENFVKEKAILLENIAQVRLTLEIKCVTWASNEQPTWLTFTCVCYRAKEQIAILKMTTRNQTIIIENFVKEKAILLENITQVRLTLEIKCVTWASNEQPTWLTFTCVCNRAKEQIAILKMTTRNQTIIIDKMRNEIHNVSTIINKAENYSTENESRILNQTQRIPEEKSTKTHREYQDTTLTIVQVTVISSICTAVIVTPVACLCRDRICKRKERSLTLQKGKSRCRKKNRTIWTKPTGPENDHNSKLITSCTV